MVADLSGDGDGFAFEVGEFGVGDAGTGEGDDGESLVRIESAHVEEGGILGHVDLGDLAGHGGGLSDVVGCLVGGEDGLRQGGAGKQKDGEEG